MTTDEIVDYYTGLLILQYSALDNATGTVQALIRALVQDQIISKVRDGFDVTTAIGNQLNILATYRGLSRQVFGVTPGDYWSLVPYADAAPGSYFGWAEYADPDPDWKFLQYVDLDGLAYTLTDNQLRRLIQFRAATQSSPMGLADIDNILYSTFGSYVNLADNENMSITYNHDHLDPDVDGLWAVTVLSDSLPAPAGVSFTVVEV
jgi:Protein of unknown function (DUF2612)